MFLILGFKILNIFILGCMILYTDHINHMLCVFLFLQRPENLLKKFCQKVLKAIGLNSGSYCISFQFKVKET